MTRAHIVAFGVGIGTAMLMIAVLPTMFGQIAAINPMVPHLIRLEGGLKLVGLVLHDLVLMSVLLLPLSLGLVVWNKPHLTLQAGVAALLFAILAYSGPNYSIITTVACFPLSVLLVKLIAMKESANDTKI